ELAGHPLWATVREAKLSETGDPAPIITHPVMQSLRVVHMWTYPRGLQGLLESDAPVEEIHDLYLPNVKRDKKLWSTFVGCKGLPSLRLLKVSGATLETAAELWSGAIARSGMQIFQRVDAAWRLTEWIAALAESRPEHFSLTLFTDHIDVAFEGDSLVITLGPHALDALEEAASALDALGKKDGLSEGQLSRVRLRLPKGGVKGSYPHEKPATAKAMLGAIESICAKRKCPLVIEEGDFDLAYPREARPRYS
ncbi:MAG: hypothetical protein KC731_31265, partial [Myxococcales bacterium]|nr:hypothetical protein [Myxococcales bacterium]